MEDGSTNCRGRQTEKRKATILQQNHHKAEIILSDLGVEGDVISERTPGPDLVGIIKIRPKVDKNGDAIIVPQNDTD